WLKQCLARRPEDSTVWRARLEWATATGRVAEAVDALRHLPAGRLEPAQLLTLRAWLAAHRGDDRAEHSALTRRLEREPGDTQAVARLAELVARAGQTAQVSELRRREAELDRAAEAYRKLLTPAVPTGRYDQLGRLAETLGRWFEARGWWTLA